MQAGLVGIALRVNTDESADCGKRIVMEHLTVKERQMVMEGTWNARIVKYKHLDVAAAI